MPHNVKDNTNLIARNLGLINERIKQATLAANRPLGSVQLIAVSKTKPEALIEQALEAGQLSFGENYAQELERKAHNLKVDWHFIGPLQSNKTKLIAEAAHWAHGVDRLKIARRLSEQRPEHLAPLNLCIQVNISEEPQKAGVSPSEVLALAEAIRELPRVTLRGLMCIPSAEDPTAFQRMATLKADLTEHGIELDTLSMGMSNDFEQAIAHGATHVRVGTAIFGARQ